MGFLHIFVKFRAARPRPVLKGRTEQKAGPPGRKLSPAEARAFLAPGYFTKRAAASRARSYS